MPMQQFLNFKFINVKRKNIESVFGFSDRCRIYGGRHFVGPEITNIDLKWMYDNGIGYRIPLTSFLVNKELYDEAKPFLQKYHRENNSVIVVKDKLAEWIKNDFPLYNVECSVIKETDTVEKLYQALELYDTVVPLPEAFNTNYKLLDSFTNDVKDRIRLFLNIGCNFNCPARICYGSFSKMNRGDTNAKFQCSQLNNKKHISNGMIDFDIQKYIDIGYKNFKMLRERNGKAGTGF